MLLHDGDQSADGSLHPTYWHSVLKVQAYPFAAHLGTTARKITGTKWERKIILKNALIFRRSFPRGAGTVTVAGLRDLSRSGGSAANTAAGMSVQ